MQSKQKTSLRAVTKRSAGFFPSLITTASVFCAFYSLVAAWQEQFTQAALAIIIAAFLDAFDGRVARLVKRSSSFGEHYDSLADVMAFGIAPAFLAFTVGLYYFEALGMGLAFIYVACCCVRLARFAAGSEGVYSFRGMPSPTGGGYVASLIWLFEIYPFPAMAELTALALCIFGTGLLMVSPLPFISGRSFHFFSRSHSIFNIILAIFYLGTLISFPALTLFFSGCLYILLALGTGLKRYFIQKQHTHSSHKSESAGQ